jgi:thiol-disulfide isomerase/thioredoxin
MGLSRLNRVATGVIVLALLGVLGVAAAQSPGQATATPDSTPPAIPPISTPTESAAPDLAALAEAVRQENLSWENITFWQEGTLGDPALEALALSVGIGDELPDFEMPLLDGGRFRLADETGPLLVNFWASWCGPCRLELPYLLEMQADPDAPFDLALVNVLDDETGYRTLAEAEFPAGLRTGRAPDDALVGTLDIRGIPVSILVDRNLRVQAIHVGNITPAVVDFLYRLAGDEASSVEASPAAPQDSLPQDLLDEVQRANGEGGAVTIWAGGTLGQVVPPPIGVAVGSKFPGFGLVSTQGENFVSDLAGQPMLYNFWASWCGSCVDEFPLLIEHSQASGVPYQVAFVNIWDDPVTAGQFLVAYPTDILVLPDVRNALPDVYGLSMVPVSLVVDGSGAIVAIQIGPVNAAFLQLADALVQDHS